MFNPPSRLKERQYPARAGRDAILSARARARSRETSDAGSQDHGEHRQSGEGGAGTQGDQGDQGDYGDHDRGGHGLAR
jgi:hypothetical protein